MERSRKLERQFKRYLGAENAETLLSAFSTRLLQGALTADDDAICQEIAAILGKFPDFANAIDKAYVEYDDRINIAARNIEISSGELTDAYKKLERLNANINAMLDSIGQGFLFFDEDGICSSVYSKACVDILGKDPSGAHLPQLLGFSEKQEKTFQSWLKIVFSGNSALDFGDMKLLLPREIIVADTRIVEIDYRPMYVVEDQLMGVLLIASDVTEKRKADQQLAETTALAQKIQYVAQNRNGYASLLSDLTAFLDSLDNIPPGAATQNDREVTLRDLHTYKGLSAMFNMVDIATALNNAETALASVDPDHFTTILRQERIAIAPLLMKEKEFAESIFGPEFLNAGEVKIIETRKIEELETLVASLLTNSSDRYRVNDFINKNFLSAPIFDSFFPFEREIQRLAAQQGKPPVLFLISGDNITIRATDYAALFENLIHVARNIIDHGIEHPDIREAAGKNAEGRVSVHIVAPAHDAITITISDDGAGIRAQQIRERMMQKSNTDLSAINDHDTLQYIFAPDFSTRTEASMLSGRGIGLCAVKQAVQDMGGTISVASDPGHKPGTVLTMTIPRVAQV